MSEFSFSIPARRPGDNFDRVFNAHFPNCAESKLLIEIAYTPEADRRKSLELIEKHKNYNNFSDFLDELRMVDPEMYGKVEPLYERLREAYLSLSGDAKVFMKQYFDEIWSNAVASLHDSENQHMITKEQIRGLKRKLDALTAEQQKSIELKFPMFFNFIDMASSE